MHGVGWVGQQARQRCERQFCDCCSCRQPSVTRMPLQNVLPTAKQPVCPHAQPPLTFRRLPTCAHACNKHCAHPRCRCPALLLSGVADSMSSIVEHAAVLLALCRNTAGQAAAHLNAVSAGTPLSCFRCWCTSLCYCCSLRVHARAELSLRLCLCQCVP